MWTTQSSDHRRANVAQLSPMPKSPWSTRRWGLWGCRGSAPYTAACNSTTKGAFVEVDGVFQAPVKCVRNKGVANADFREVGNVLGKKGQVLGVEVVPGVDAQAQGMGHLGAVRVGRHGVFRVFGVPHGVIFRVEFNAVRPHVGRAAQVFFVALHK